MKLSSLVHWLFKPTEKLIVEEHGLYDKLVELEQRIERLEHEQRKTID